MQPQNKRLIFFLVAIAVLLLIPFIAMQFTNEVNWSAFDFVVMEVLLLGTALTAELILRITKKKRYKVLLIAVIIIAFLLIWAELAVGVFGMPFAGNWIIFT